jgi:imidazolonepropionase-like amidohydrolase
MMQAGLTNLQALMAVTSSNARMLQMDDRIGYIKPGMLADLVAIDGDPLADILTLSKVKLVMKGGAVQK